MIKIVSSPEIEQVKSKFYAHLARVENLREQLETAKMEVANLKKQLAAKHEEITLLRDRLNNREIAGAVAGEGAAEVDAARAKITELMREIDKCIALLNV